MPYQSGSLSAACACMLTTRPVSYFYFLISLYSSYGAYSSAHIWWPSLRLAISTTVHTYLYKYSYKCCCVAYSVSLGLCDVRGHALRFGGCTALLCQSPGQQSAAHEALLGAHSTMRTTHAVAGLPCAQAVHMLAFASACSVQ